jgi:hypothetical protein
MFHWRRCIISVLPILGATWFSGCRNGNAQSVPGQPSATAAQGPRPTVAKHALHDSAFSTYNNPNYGVTFRYPRNYFLDDAFGPEDAPILEARQKLGAQQPGATLVATVTIPPDAYPNTTFVSGTLQLIVNPRVTRETCQSFAVPLDEGYTYGSTSIQGVNFHWRQRGSAAAGTGFLNRDYAGYSNGTCYEFFLGIVTGSNPDLDPGIKDANEVKIMRQLEKIVLSLQIHNPHASYNPL